VLIGTAVVGATTMIFSIIMSLTNGLTGDLKSLSILYPPFFLGLIAGGAVIYWFTGASIQAVSTGAYRAVEFIKANIKLEGTTKASVADSKKGRRDLYAVCAEGNGQHIPGGVLLDAVVRVLRSVLVYRVSDLDRAVRFVPGDLHGQRGRCLG
jgi:Na+/H+-translocating membrane pyrophosphatase